MVEVARRKGPNFLEVAMRTTLAIGLSLIVLACGGQAPKDPAAPAVDPSATITSFKPGKAAITAGDSTVLTWNVSGADRLVLEPGAIDVTGQTSRTVTPSATTTYTLSATGGGTTKTSTARVDVYAPPTAQLTALDTTLDSGMAAQLTPTFTGGSGVLTPGALAVQSGVPVTTAPLDTTTTFTLTVTNAAGRSAQRSVTVSVAGAPVATITAPDPVTPQATGLTASVPAQAGVTYAWTLSNGTLTAGQGTRQITFTAGAAGTLTLGCTVTSSNGVPVLGTRTLTVSAPVPVPPPVAGEAVGAPWAADSLMNHVVSTRKVALRFRAKTSSSLQTLRTYFVPNDGGSGYASGTGGQALIEVYADDGTAGHAPAGAPLASTTWTPGYTNGEDPKGNTHWFSLLTFANPAALQAGQLYHIVFSNTDANASSNWYSVNGLVNWTTTEAQAGATTTDWAVLNSTGSGWTDRIIVNGKDSINTPILELGYGNGTRQGNGYMEVWIGQPHTASATTSVRETFTLKSDLKIGAMAVRLKRTTASGTLVLRLEKADGSTVAEQTVDGALIGTDRHHWAQATLAAPVTLTAGQGYNLVVKATDGSFTVYPIRDGGEFGFKDGAVFADGKCQWNAGGGWQGWDGWSSGGSSSYVWGDLQFYFTVVP